MESEDRQRSLTDLREMVTRWTHGRSRPSAPALQAVGLTASTTSDADNLSGEEPTGHVDDAAYEREFLGHLLDATKTMLP